MGGTHLDKSVKTTPHAACACGGASRGSRPHVTCHMSRWCARRDGPTPQRGEYVVTEPNNRQILCTTCISAIFLSLGSHGDTQCSMAELIQDFLRGQARSARTSSTARRPPAGSGERGRGQVQNSSATSVCGRALITDVVPTSRFWTDDQDEAPLPGCGRARAGAASSGFPRRGVAAERKRVRGLGRHVHGDV